MIDVLVAGGGPAGLTTALYGAKAGLEVVVIEKRSGTIDKACGEGLMPHSLAHLNRLGVDSPGKPFYGIAAEFTEQARLTNLEASAAEAHTLPEDQRQAWLAGEQAAHRLDKLLPVLTAAAQLAGLAINDDSALIGLCCQIPPEAHRRRCWEAWLASGRCGRWSKLISLGVTIKATELGAFTPIPECQPIELRQVPIAQGVYRTEKHDPFDPDYKPAVQQMEPHRQRTGKAIIV